MHCIASVGASIWWEMQRGVRIITRSRRSNYRRRSRKILWKKSCLKGNFKRLQKLKIQDRVPRPTLIECAIWNWESKKEKDLRLLAAERLHQIWNWVEGKVLFGTHPVKRGRKSHFLSGILNRDTYIQVGFSKKKPLENANNICQCCCEGGPLCVVAAGSWWTEDVTECYKRSSVYVVQTMHYAAIPM